LTASISPQVFDRHALAHRPRVATGEIEVRVVRDWAVCAALEALTSTIESHAARPRMQAALSRLVGATLRAIHLSETRRLANGRLRPEVDHVRRLLEERFDQPVTLEELHSEVGLSKFHLLRLFRDQLGAPPHAYQLQVRISHARVMLREGATAAEVALRCGFADQAHFTRCFKRMVGYSPAAFARLG
jgi:AraC-like DNA-binding protein